jgi:hypothetical protein
VNPVTDPAIHGWQPVLDLPPDFHSTCLLPIPGGVLLGGWLGALDLPPERRRAVLLEARWDPEPGLVTRYEADGWIAAADLRSDGVGHALRITGSDGTVSRRLLHTDTGGSTWGDRGPVGGSSALKVLSCGPSEAWVQGAGALLVTRDAGATWRVLEAPGPRDPVGDRLFRIEDRVVLAAPDGAFVTRDGGRTWRRRPLGPVHVRAVDGSYIAARRGSETLLGQPFRKQVRWFGRIKTPLDPFDLRVASPRVQLLAVRIDDEAGPVQLLLESRDDGATFVALRLGVPPGPGHATLTDDGSVVAVEAGGRLLVRAWNA